ncbi:unnamed protein product [marine sediment metagenome]|uniref:Uncharacterized protein n=1 Tax=marine sediment metagenome TaxID=412755 RepID=X1RIL5_9ZZZZ
MQVELESLLSSFAAATAQLGWSLSGKDLGSQHCWQTEPKDGGSASGHSLARVTDHASGEQCTGDACYRHAQQESNAGD